MLYRTTLFAGFLCALFSGTGNAEQSLTLVYVPISAYSASFVAKDQGFFEKHGLNIDMKAAPGGTAPIASVVAGSAQITTTTPTQLLQAGEQGIDLVILAGGTYPTGLPHSNGIVARSDSRIKTPSDMVGKKVGIGGFGSIVDVLARSWVRASGIDDRKINWVEIQFPQVADSLRSGLVDAATDTNPFMASVISSGAAYEVVDFNSVAAPGALTVGYVASRSWTDANRDTVTAFRQALRDAASFIADSSHDDAIKAAIAKFTFLPPQAVGSVPISRSVGPDVTASALPFWIKASREQGLISGNPDPERFFVQ